MSCHFCQKLKCKMFLYDSCPLDAEWTAASLREGPSFNENTPISCSHWSLHTSPWKSPAPPTSCHHCCAQSLVVTVLSSVASYTLGDPSQIMPLLNSPQTTSFECHLSTEKRDKTEIKQKHLLGISKLIRGTQIWVAT